MLRKMVQFVASYPWIYDQIQDMTGIAIPVTPYLAQTVNSTVLDLGAGTGKFASLLPLSARYIWLDIDRQKLNGFIAKKFPNLAILLGDATRICLKDKSVDYALCIGLTHHLTDNEMNNLFSEISRVTKYKLIFLDGVKDEKDEGSIISNLLWRYDRGSHPRQLREICDGLNSIFDIEQIDQFKIYKRYVICVCVPKQRSIASL